MTRQTPLPLALAGLLALAAPSLRGESLPCQPCAGARLADPAAAADALAAIAKPAKLEPGSPLFVAWDVPLDGTADLELAGSIWAAGATPWLTLTFRTPAPLTGNLARLQGELEAAAKVAAAAPPKSFFQVVWRPESAPAAANPATPETPAAAETPAPFDPSQYGFLLKRAAVALTGASSEGKIATEPLPADPGPLRALYAEEIAAYLEAVALAPAPPDQLAAAVETLGQLDPGRPIVVDALPAPAEPGGVLAEAARNAARGVALTLFAAPTAEAAPLGPLALLAREFAGDLSYDPTSSPASPGG
ncbi:MAG TPA: hypothetical protein VN783_16500, partial [Thermoanaerobaculia bacterium]|nr:hypothetical protein [Thermoanaerobaculia bacterium]